MVKTCWTLMSQRKGTKSWHKAGPYIFPRKSDFGSLAKLKKNNPELNLKFKTVKCPVKVRKR